MLCEQLHAGHVISVTSSMERTKSLRQSAQRSFLHGVSTGRSSIWRQIEHWKSVSVILAAGGRKRLTKRGFAAPQLFGAIESTVLPIPFGLSLAGRPHFLVPFFFRPPIWSIEDILQTSQSSLSAWGDQL